MSATGFAIVAKPSASGARQFAHAFGRFAVAGELPAMHAKVPANAGEVAAN